MPDVMSAGAVMRALIPEALLSIGALVLLLASVWKPQNNVSGAAEGGERTSVLSRFGIVWCLLVALSVFIAWGDGSSASIDGRIASDGFRWSMDLIILLGTTATLMLLEAEHHRSAAYGPEVPALILLSACGMMILAGARDLMFIFIGFELMSLAVYVMAGINRRSARSAEAAMKYFILGAISSAFLLYGMALLYGATGSTRLADIAQWTASHPALTPLFMAGLGFLLVGMAFKIGAAPFHMWTPDVYDGAPLPVTAFMSATVKAAAFAMLARIMLEAFNGALPRWHDAMWWLSVATMVVGNIFALSQRNLVRMLAYSSIAHAGYLLIAIVSGTPAGLEALVFYLVAYTLAVMGAFAVLITINGGRDKAPTVDDIAGLWLVRPWLAIGMTVFLLSFMGMPILGGMGFFAKWYLLQVSLQAPAPQTILAVLLVLTSAVSAAYYLSVVAAMFMRARPQAQPVPTTTPLNRSLITVAAVLLLVFGLYPSPVMRIAKQATSTVVAPLSSPANIRIQTAQLSP